MSEEYFDENNKKVSKEKMHLLQEIVASFFENFVCLTDAQVADLQSKLPKKLNNVPVKVGHKAVFPPVLDTERKKVSRARVVQKANRLRYIENDAVRGLKMPEGKTARYEESHRARKDLIRTLMALNYSDYEMCEYMNVPPKDLSRLKKEVFFEELSVHKQMNNDELFIQYKLQQMEVIKDLDVVIERFKGSKQLTALTAAMKAKSDIYNEIINKGYEFGVIEKTPEKSAVLVGSMDVTAASIKELQDAARKNSDEMNRIINSDNFLGAGVDE